MSITGKNMNKKDIEQLIEKYGFTNLGPQKMSILISCEYKDTRINIYTTTGTVTVQLKSEKYDPGEIFKKVDIDYLEQIFQDVKAL